MKTQISSVVRFVEDFKLEGIGGTVCFEAVILYTSAKRQVKLLTEVNIIRLDILKMEVIYLLEPGVVKHGIPTMIDKPTKVYYEPNKYLFVKDSNVNDGGFVLSIHPLTTTCGLKTLQELYAKAYN